MFGRQTRYSANKKKTGGEKRNPAAAEMFRMLYSMNRQLSAEASRAVAILWSSQIMPPYPGKEISTILILFKKGPATT